MFYFLRFFQKMPYLSHSFLLLLLLPFFWVDDSNGADGDELVYALRQGDNLWNITEHYLDGGFQHFNSLLKLNNITNPTQMLPGTKIRIPVSWLRIDPTVVVVRKIYGAVHYVEAQQKTPQQLTLATVLHEGDQIVVGEESNVVLEFSDTSSLFLGSGSQMELQKTVKFSDTGLADTKVKLQRGRTESKVLRKNSRFQITTPSATTAVRGTDFRVAIDPSNPDLSKVEVLSGAVGVSGAQRKRHVKAGKGTTIFRGQAPDLPVKLLPQPVISSPPKYSRKLPVDIKWQKINGAKGYRVQIHQAEGQQTLLFDKVIQIPRINTSTLEDGKYTVVVRGIDEKGLEGKDGEYTFELDARPLAPMTISPQPEETVREDLPEFEWSTPPQGNIYHFQLSENPDFYSPIINSTEFNSTRYSPDQLAPGTYFWRIATIDQNEEGPFSMTNKFVLRPSPDAPEVSAQEGENEITLMWPPGTSGQKYNVQLSHDSKFTNIFKEDILEEASWTIQRPKQEIFFRVRIIDVDGFKGDWSPEQLIKPPPPPWYYSLVPVFMFLAVIIL